MGIVENQLGTSETEQNDQCGIRIVDHYHYHGD